MKINRSDLIQLKPEEIKIGDDVIIVLGRDITQRKLVVPSLSEWTKCNHKDTLPAQITTILGFYKTLAKKGQLFKLKTTEKK